MSICLPDYNNCTVNLACSILKEFGAERPEHPTLPAADRLLSKKHYTNIVVLLLDALGQNVLEHNLDADGFFRRHLITTYSSVFPSTTAAATTARSARRNTAGSAGTVIFPRSGAPLPYY